MGLVVGTTEKCRATLLNYRLLHCLLVPLILVSCNATKGLFEEQDSAPRRTVDPSTIKDAVPREDLITRAGNKNPYTVLGKTYHLLPTSKGYKEEGIASWYGTKFHGRPTANGEPYSLYGMTAAHKTLPIPAYVKVTNLANNRTAVVRVNDRGPFHADRVIDLSYAAAVKLGYEEQGTARVLIETIEPNSYDTELADAENPRQYILQVGAFKSLQSAAKLRAELILGTSQEVNIRPTEPAGYYRVQLGPLNSMNEVKQLSEQLLEFNISQPRIIAE
ncbi:MAG: septal ring lytic transglycosylase RlpA family protein [Oceanicoccus sp.]|nr:septal ring lytic transglycosylase RlpA family protein [Oceanicoccus sp.]